MSKNTTHGYNITFVKLKTHIIGAYGDYELLKPYYDRYKWKFKVSDLIRPNGENVGPGCFFSLDQSDILLPQMAEDGWNISGVSELISLMRDAIEKKSIAQEAEKKLKEMEEQIQQKEEDNQYPTIHFKFLKYDQFVIYGNTPKIEAVLDTMKYPRVKKSLIDFNIVVPSYGYVVTYRFLIPFIDKLKEGWNVDRVRKWAENYAWDIVNPEKEANVVIDSIQDMNNFFEWCYKNQTKLYAGTLNSKYKSLKGNWRMKHFIKRLCNFFKRASNISPECKEWYQLHEPKFEEDSEVYAGKAPRAWLISTAMRN